MPPDVRERLLLAALELLREQGLAGLTQPRVAKAAKISQSHLTYYFPTRADLLLAVLERAAAAQQAGVAASFAAADQGAGALAAAVASTLSRVENTRVLVSFVLASDGDPAARALYAKLVSGMRTAIAETLPKIGAQSDEDAVLMTHALGTGLAIIALALGEAMPPERIQSALERLFSALSATVPDEEAR